MLTDVYNNTYNYCVVRDYNDWHEGMPIQPNVIKIMELIFIPHEIAADRAPYSFSYIVFILREAQNMLSEEEIISEVSTYKAPTARYIDKKILYDATTVQ